MPSTRRRFLTGATGLAVALAGCNESASRPVEETLTPVEVPRTDEEILGELREIERPSIPSPVLVSDAHFEAAVAHVETLRSEVAEGLEAVDGSADSTDVVRSPRSPSSALEHADEQLAEAHELGPSVEAIDRLRSTVDELATARGFLRVETDAVDPESIRADVEAERAAASALRDRVDYRIARPVADHLPTGHAAEERLASLRDLEDVERHLEDFAETDERHAGPIASVHRRLEGHRRRREDAESFLETATDPDAPSIRRALDDELDSLESELEEIADRVAEEWTDGPDSESASGEFRNIRRSVGEQSVQTRNRIREHREDGRRLYALFRGLEQVVEYEAIDAAVAATLPLLRGREFPTERLLDEQVRAVEAVERVAEAAPIQRSLAETAPMLLRSASGVASPDGVEDRRLGRAHLLFYGAAEWADGALDRGEALSESLQAQQS